jgi:hypothetical protein
LSATTASGCFGFPAEPRAQRFRPR